MQTIPPEQVEERLKAENPWWVKGGRIPPDIQAMRARPYFTLFFPLVQQQAVRRAVLLLGPRRVGKTVMIHHAIGKLIDAGTDPQAIHYVSVDHPLYNGLGLEELVGHLRSASGISPDHHPTFIFFDEIQYLRDWEIHLKSMVDRHPELSITASGSAAAALRLKSRESGAGRFTDFLLPPLTFHEFLHLLDRVPEIDVNVPESEARAVLSVSDVTSLNREFLRYVNFGGYPEAIFSKAIQANPERFVRSDIIDKVLLRDLPSLYGISDIQELNSLFTTLAFNSAQEVSLEDLSKGSGVAKNTLRRYIEYLEAAFLIRVVHRIDRNARRFRRAVQFKTYLTNPSMRAALFSAVQSDSEAMGSLAETAVFAQWFHAAAPLHYARWNTGEVDIVALDPSQRVAWAADVKWSDRHVKRLELLRGLVHFAHATNPGHVIVTTRTVEAERVVKGVKITFIPCSVYVYLVGRRIIEGKPDPWLPR